MEAIVKVSSISKWIEIKCCRNSSNTKQQNNVKRNLFSPWLNPFKHNIDAVRSGLGL